MLSLAVRSFIAPVGSYFVMFIMIVDVTKVYVGFCQVVSFNLGLGDPAIDRTWPPVPSSTHALAPGIQYRRRRRAGWDW